MTRPSSEITVATGAPVVHASRSSVRAGKPVSSKPAEVRMGSGKGTPEFWACRIHPGRIMFEVDGVPREVARRALELAAAKLPLKTRFVSRLGEE
jgi:large subunit ribosomal protein L16